MTESLKTGKEIVDAFFIKISDSEQLDKAVVDTLKQLHIEGKLTNTNISNALDSVRKVALDDVN